jgi:hypothetical protein
MTVGSAGENGTSKLSSGAFRPRTEGEVRGAVSEQRTRRREQGCPAHAAVNYALLRQPPAKNPGLAVIAEPLSASPRKL